MIVRVVTLSGSVYDVDPEAKTVCRRGADGVTERASATPRTYHGIGFAGGVLWIVWDETGHATRSSPVVSVERVFGD